ADEKTPYGKVIEVMDLLKQAKVDKVGLLFKPVS
ncbi:MAG: protein TolR, partial [Methylotenera sp.]